MNPIEKGNNATAKAAVSRRALIRGIRLFIVLTLAAFMVIFFATGSRETLQALQHLHVGFYVLALLLNGVDLLLGAARIHIFIRKMTPLTARRSFAAAFRANGSNLFMAAATPFQTGGGLAQIYILNKAGVSVSGATAVSVVNFFATILFLLGAGPAILHWIVRAETNLHVRFIFGFSSVFFYLISLLFIAFLFRPVSIGKLVERLIVRIGRLWKKKKESLEAAALRVHDFVAGFRSHTLTFWREEKLTLFHNFWITCILYLNKCIIAYVVIRGLGIHADFIQVVWIQILLIFLIYFCPTPGASFLAETSAAVLMSVIIPRHTIPVFSLLWRFFTTHIGVIVGGIVLMRAIGLKAPGGKSPTANPERR